MPFPAASNPKTDSKTDMDVAKKPDAVAVTDEPSEPVAPSSPESSRGSLKKSRSFASIPVFFRPRNVKDKPDFTSAKDVNIPTEAPKVFADREILSKHQLPISQWPTYSTYVAMAVDKRSAIPTPTKLDEAPRQTKHEDILDYIYDWAAWATEIPNEARRHEVLGWVMRTLERALKDGMERTGMMLKASDVQGTKNGTKRTLEGEVNIQVIITNSLKEKPGSELNNSAVQKAKYKQANRGATATIPSEPTVKQQALSKTKRPAGELNEFRAAQDAKRQKVEVAKESKKTLATDKADAQQEESRESRVRSTSESTTTEDDEKWVQYIQHIFLPRLNHILKRAGKSLSRGKCRNWETVRERLIAAGVSVKYRNMMLRDFQHGHEKWDGDNQVDPNVELASFAESFQRPPKASPVVAANNANKQAVKKDAESNTSNTQTLFLTHEGMPVLNTKTPVPNAFIPAQPVTSSLFPIAHTPSPPTPTHQLTFSTILQYHRSPAHQPAVPKTSLTLTLRTFPGFDPEDYSTYGQYQHENFMFVFTRASTVKERVLISDTLMTKIDAELDAAVANDDILDSRTRPIRNKRGKVVAVGNFVDLNSDYMVQKGIADTARPWVWKGRTFKGEVVPVVEVET